MGNLRRAFNGVLRDRLGVEGLQRFRALTKEVRRAASRRAALIDALSVLEAQVGAERTEEVRLALAEAWKSYEDGLAAKREALIELAKS
jgi:recombinational DNA repair protein (RecF pathway)